MATKSIVISMYRDMLRSATGFKVRRVPLTYCRVLDKCPSHRRITTFADMLSGGFKKSFGPTQRYPQSLFLPCWKL